MSRVRGVMDTVGTRAQSGDVVGALTSAVGEGFEAADELRRGVTSAVSEAIEGSPVPADTTLDSPPPPQTAFQPAKSGPYTGVRAFVAGANGRTGRLLVESLVRGRAAQPHITLRKLPIAEGARSLEVRQLDKQSLHTYIETNSTTFWASLPI